MLTLLIAIGLGLVLIERLRPSMELPRVHAWWPRVILINLVQLGIVVVAGLTWDRWMEGISLFRSRDHMAPWAQGTVAYLVASFIYYWWHRARHDSKLLWLLCHQVHHSPRRIEVITAFYKHPVEILLNSILSSSIAYLLIGCTVEGAAIYTFLAGVAEFFYHWNIETPRWLGYLIQRPESHRVHHQKGHHSQNYGDLPVFDILFGTFHNPKRFEATCGFDDWREDRFEDMLAFRDVHGDGMEGRSPLRFLPSWLGCERSGTRPQGASGESDERVP